MEHIEVPQCQKELPVITITDPAGCNPTGCNPTGCNPDGTRERSSSSTSDLTEETRYELTQWAIHELIEQNRENEATNRRQKKIMGGLGLVTAGVSLALVISELIKVWA